MESCEMTFSVTLTNIPPSAQQHQNQGGDWTPHSLNSTQAYLTPVCVLDTVWSPSHFVYYHKDTVMQHSTVYWQ